jgi:hypothetical protein
VCAACVVRARVLRQMQQNDVLKQKFAQYVYTNHHSVEKCIAMFAEQAHPDSLLLNVAIDVSLALQNDPELARMLIMKFGNQELQSLFQVRCCLLRERARKRCRRH